MSAYDAYQHEYDLTVRVVPKPLHTPGRPMMMLSVRISERSGRSRSWIDPEGPFLEWSAAPAALGWFRNCLGSSAHRSSRSKADAGTGLRKSQCRQGEPSVAKPLRCSRKMPGLTKTFRISRSVVLPCHMGFSSLRWGWETRCDARSRSILAACCLHSVSGD